MARLVFGLCLLLAPALAWADPFSLLATAIVSGAGLTGLGALAVYAGAGLLRTNAAKKKAKKARAAQIAAYNASLQDRTTQFASVESTERYVYGSPAPIAGSIVANFVSGDKDEFRHLVIYLASHESQACDGIYIDGVNIGALDGDGWVTGGEFFESGADVQATPVGFAGASVVLPVAPVAASVEVYASDGIFSYVVPHSLSGSTVTVSAPYDTGDKVVQYRHTSGNARVRVNMHLSPGGVDTADAGLMAAVPAKWTSAHKASNTTYAVVTLDLRMSRFQAGPPTFTFKLRGKKVYDPRTLATVYSPNAILCSMDYLRTRHGGGVALAAFDASWIAAANSADTAAYTAAPNTGNTTELFRCDGVFTLDQGRDAIIAQFEASFSGEISESSGLWRVRAGVWTAPVLTLGDADIFGFVEQLQGGFPLEARFNGARGQYLDAAGLGVPQDAKPYSNATFLSADGEPRIDDVPLGFIGSEQRAQHAMRVRVERSRGGQTLRVPASPKAWLLQPGDRVTLTYSPYGITARDFRVTGWGASLGGATALELERDDPAIWDLADATTAYTQPTSDLPNGFVTPALAGLDADSGDAYLRKGVDGTIITGVRLTWDAATNPYVLQGGRVEIQTRSALDADGAWQPHPSEDGTFTFSTIYGLQDGLHYIIRARFVNQREVPGNWSTITHQVVGKTAAPPAFDVFTVLAQPDGTRQYNFGYTSTAQPLDWLGAQIRYTPGAVGSPVWESMTQLQDGETYYTDSPVERNAPLAGEYTFACRSLDTSGNPSTALVRTITLGQRRTGRVFDEFNERSSGWPGTRGGMTELVDPVNGGSYLEATDSTTWDDLTTWDAWARWNTSPASPGSYTSDVKDLGTVLAGQIDVPLLDADGSEVVEIRSSLDNVTFTAWGSPASAFTARYVQIRITLTATGGEPVPALRQFGWQVSADLRREYLNDINIAALTGSYRIGTGDVRVPLANSYAVIKRLGVTIQDAGAGSWTWQRIDNVLAFGPRVQFRYNGALADPALVDFDIEGI